MSAEEFESFRADLKLARKRRRKSRALSARTLPLGVLSEGTLRVEDIAPELLDAIGALTLSRADRQQINNLRREWQLLDGVDSEDTAPGDGSSMTVGEQRDFILDDLYQLGETYVPDYCYLGSADGDGACIGVWVSWDSVESDRIGRYAEIASSREQATGEQRFALEVSDHGNATLWRRSGRTWREVWAVV